MVKKRKKKNFVVKGTFKGKAVIISPAKKRFTRKEATTFLKRIRKNPLTKKLRIRNPRIGKVRR